MRQFLRFFLFIFLSSADISHALFNEDFYVLVDKKANELKVISLETSKVLKTYRAISGLNPGDKMVEGDRKTPEGVYFVTGGIPQSRIVPSLHGVAGVGLSYPNPVDRINKQTGSGIWIHGVESDARLDRRFDTRGCVALGNNDIRELKPFLTKTDTTVVIVDEVKPMIPVGLVSQDSFLIKRMIDWLAAWNSKSAESYLSFYHPDFYSRDMNFRQWSAYKTRLTKQYDFIKVQIKNLRVFRHYKYSVATFDQVYQSNVFQSVGRKRLYWVGPDENAKIIAEESIETRQGPAGSFAISDYDTGESPSLIPELSSGN